MRPALSDGPRASPARIRIVVAMGAAVEKTRAKAMPVVVATSAADGRAAAGRRRVGAVIPHFLRRGLERDLEGNAASELRFSYGDEDYWDVMERLGMSADYALDVS